MEFVLKHSRFYCVSAYVTGMSQIGNESKEWVKTAIPECFFSTHFNVHVHITVVAVINQYQQWGKTMEDTKHQWFHSVEEVIYSLGKWYGIYQKWVVFETMSQQIHVHMRGISETLLGSNKNRPGSHYMNVNCQDWQTQNCAENLHEHGLYVSDDLSPCHFTVFTFHNLSDPASSLKIFLPSLLQGRLLEAPTWCTLTPPAPLQLPMAS